MQMQWESLMYFLPLILEFVSAEFPICDDKDDCGEGYTCLDGTCKECLACSLILRKGDSCITDFRECGDCLEGYEEVSVTFFSSTAKPCKPVKRKVKFKVCTSSNSCPPNNYCSEDSCIECFDCAVVNRLPPVGGCAKGLIECGSCINGFSEATVTADTNYTRCQRVISINTPFVNILWLSFMALGCFLFLIGLLLKKISKISSSHTITSHIHTISASSP